MFGRVRAAPSSSSSSSSTLDCLELERPPSKFFKDDSLSIYEITLNKLKLGSKRALKSSPGEETNSSLSATESMKLDVPCPTASTSPSSNGDQAIDICKQQLEDNSCNSPAVFKYKRWPWTNSNMLPLNPESQLLGHKA